MSSVYHINKGVNTTVEFKGLKAQWIWRLGAGLVALLIVFAVLYITGINSLFCVFIVGVSGAVLFVRIYQLNDRYGPWGLMKKNAAHRLPPFLSIHSRKIFYA